jgi:hypothetical protein
VDVGAVCRYIRYLAGQPDADLASSRDVQPHGTWGSAGGSAAAAGARGSSVCPLVATSDASSHAPHLYAQLGLHRNCLDHMRGMKSAISLQLAAAGELVEAAQHAQHRHDLQFAQVFPVGVSSRACSVRSRRTPIGAGY